jgi:hypothetical protein
MHGEVNGALTDRDRRGRFANGNTEYRAKQQRVAEKARQLAAEYDPSPSQQQQLNAIARFLDDAERARTVERRARAANTANRLLRHLKRREAPLRSMPEIMAGVGK